MLGEIAALGAAFFWALASLLYGKFSHHFNALQLNLIKGVIASCLMLITLPLLPDVNLVISDKHILVLVLSGIIGIAIGDSAYFASLSRIGVNKTLLLESIAPPLSGVLALLLLGAVLSWQSWFGVFITTFAVTYVVATPNNGKSELNIAGIGFGLLASVCQASGVVISHYALVAGDIEPLLGALIRLTAGVFTIVMVMWVLKRADFAKMFKVASSMQTKQFILLFVAILVGTFMTLWLQQVALKHANPAVAQTLIATSPIFILLFGWLKGENPKKSTLVGTSMAVLGISLFFIFK